MQDAQNLLRRLTEIGAQQPPDPPLQSVVPFATYFDSQGRLLRDSLDALDDECTRRELLARYLLLNAVLDQGPHIEGVRALLVGVINALYERNIRILHRPHDLFVHIDMVVDEIDRQHARIKAEKAEHWATNNDSTPGRYNLLMDNSNQVLGYVTYRWCTPLGLVQQLVRRCSTEEQRATALIDYLESYDSAELASEGLKSDRRFGLGKAIGNKACHLFLKWYCGTYNLARRTDLAWGPLSYEVPFDSNAGRVLWRTGFLLRFAEVEDYKAHEVVQPGRGKQNKDYIRVTNIRWMPAKKEIPPPIEDAHAEICVHHMRTYKRKPQHVYIQGSRWS